MKIRTVFASLGIDLIYRYILKKFFIFPDPVYGIFAYSSKVSLNALRLNIYGIYSHGLSGVQGMQNVIASKISW